MQLITRLFFSLEGRIPRRTFWYGWLILAGLYVIAAATDTALGGPATGIHYGCFTVFVAIIIAAGGLSISVKRAHDLDLSGWWLLRGLIPIVGQVWLIAVLGFLKGTPGWNPYGPDPLAGKDASASAPDQEQKD